MSHSSLWTHLDFNNIDKTRTYIQRSKSSPLNIFVSNRGEARLNRALSLVIPHIPRLRSFVIYADSIPDILRDFCCTAPILEDLVIDTISPDAQILDHTLFDGNLSSLRELSLVGVATHLPWTNMANLKVFHLSCPEGHEVTLTQLLDFLESAPLLHTVEIVDSIPSSSDAPPERILLLHHLSTLSITADSVRPILNHLYIPIGASLRVWTVFSDEEPPLRGYLPEGSPNIRNLSHITAINLCFHSEDKCAQLSGPSGTFRLVAHSENPTWSTTDHRILHSLSPCILSTTQRLTISDYKHHYATKVEESPVFHTLSSMENLQTLLLSECNNRPFIFALDPEKNPSQLVLCPSLKEIVLYDILFSHMEHLINMAERRALRGAKLASITITGLGTPAPEKEVSELREHATHVEYKANAPPHSWDDVPDESGSGIGG